jgi:hypothetical protein
LDCLGAVFCLGDHRHIFLQVDKGAQPLANHGVIVDNEDANEGGFLVGEGMFVAHWAISFVKQVLTGVAI